MSPFLAGANRTLISMTPPRSRLSGFHKKSRSQRLAQLVEGQFLSQVQADALRDGTLALDVERAERTVENVIGTYSLPLAVATNFVVNDKAYVVPMAIEEPSVVAALSAGARAALPAGFRCGAQESLLIGQVVVVELADVALAHERLYEHREELLALANSLQPRMVARGGGARTVELYVYPEDHMLALHLLVDTKDAMGANLVNSMCEGLAGLIEKRTGGRVLLRILSNLTDRALVSARAAFSLEHLAQNPDESVRIRDGIIAANLFARRNVHRAATHNKGIMNGIDAVAIATGNDWRALEAGAHAFAAQSGKYQPLTDWSQDDSGNLLGTLTVPLNVGIVGGSVQANPGAQASLALLGVESAAELASVMAAVGLAQNYSALRALVGEGIQRGHMMLHARTVATSAGVPEKWFDEVVNQLISSGEIKEWKAGAILAELRENRRAQAQPSFSTAAGKILLMGEHAVVYGAHALAAPLHQAVEARVCEVPEGVHLLIPPWGVEMVVGETSYHALRSCLLEIFRALDILNRSVRIEVFPRFPRAVGLGGSAAMAVCITRALARHFELPLTPEATNRIAYACEQIAHTNPSGVDNTVSVFEHMLLYRRGDPPVWRPIRASAPLRLVVGLSGVESLTARMVEKVRAARAQNTRNTRLYDEVFAELDRLSLSMVGALEAQAPAAMGAMMNEGHELLCRIDVSHPKLDVLVQLARKHGALGAKLTGAGGGGAMIALCDEPATIVEAMEAEGFRAFAVELA